MSASSNDGEFSQEVFDVVDDDGPPQLEIMTTTNDESSPPLTPGSGDEKLFVCEAPGCGREFSKRDTFTRHKHEHTDRYKCERCNSTLMNMLGTLEADKKSNWKKRD